MSDINELISLQTIDFIPYINSEGLIDENYQEKIGVYAIFNEDKNLEYVGYSRNVYLSLKQHLVRQLDKCFWLKIYCVSQPNRSFLENIKQYWYQEYNITTVSEDLWTQPLNSQVTMTETEKEKYQQQDELGKTKLLKQVSRRLEETIKEKLISRGVSLPIRFNPKLKEKGLLDLI